MKTRRIAAAALAAVTMVGVVACSDDEDPITATDDSIEENISEELGSGLDENILSEIEARGKPEVAPVEGDVTELKVTDDVEGSGAEVTPGSTVTAHYVGVLASDGSEFDSSWDRGEPAEFPLDAVIAGWTEGLVGMKEGGRRTLVIPADMAYGSMERPGIPADSPLVFTVDMVKVS